MSLSEPESVEFMRQHRSRLWRKKSNEEDENVEFLVFILVALFSSLRVDNIFFYLLTATYLCKFYF